MLKSLAKCIGEYKGKTIGTLVLIALEVVLEIFIPFIMSQLLNVFEAYSRNELMQPLFSSIEILITKELLFKYIAIYGSIMIVMAMLSLIVGIFAGKISSEAGAGFAKNMRKKMYDNIQNFSFSNINKYSTASLITRQTTDVSNVQNAFQMGIRILIRAPFMLICSCVMCFVNAPALAAVFIAGAIILGLVIFFIGRHVFPLFRKLFKKYDDLNASIQEDLIGIRVVKSFVREKHEIDKLKGVSQELYDISVKAEGVIIRLQPVMQCTLYATMVLLAFFGGGMYINGTLGSGDLSALSQYAIMIMMSVMMIAMVLTMVIMAKSSAERIVEVLDEEATIKNPASPVYEVKDGSIDFKNVKFNYKERKDKFILSDINLHIKSGEVIGIIGGTGSAKTTLVQLLPRLYDVSSGEVLVGGVNVKEYDLDILRNNVAMVLQKNVLFSGTVKDNLRWGNVNATDEEIVMACKQAQAHDFICKLPSGYNYDLGQGGVNVSGGQKQRLCIARALLKKPKILILDDSTSAVDTKTDSLIRAELQKHSSNITKIIIAQRIASVQDADRIIVMDKGKIVAFAPHNELLCNCEIYQDVYNSQNKGGNK